MKERNVVLAIVLTIVTCGIYGLYWIYSMNNEANQLADEPNSTSGGLVILLSIITCGIYMIYWNYKMGKKVYAIQLKNNFPASDNSVLFLVLALVGLSIVNFVLIQLELNKAITREGD